MKALLLTICLTVIVMASQSQPRFGYTKSEIMAEFSGTQEVTTESGIQGLFLDHTDFTEIWSFNENGLSIQYYIIPKTSYATNTFVEVFNENYTVISPSHWRAYDNNGFYYEVRYKCDTECCFQMDIKTL